MSCKYCGNGYGNVTLHMRNCVVRLDEQIREEQRLRNKEKIYRMELEEKNKTRILAEKLKFQQTENKAKEEKIRQLEEERKNLQEALLKAKENSQTINNFNTFTNCTFVNVSHQEFHTDAMQLGNHIYDTLKCIASASGKVTLQDVNELLKKCKKEGLQMNPRVKQMVECLSESKLPSNIPDHYKKSIEELDESIVCNAIVPYLSPKDAETFEKDVEKRGALLADIWELD